MNSDSIADYLLDHPHFFEEHAELLSKIRLSSPVLGRAISLQERQMEILREKIKTQELHLASLLHAAHENDDIAAKIHTWICTLLSAQRDSTMPQTIVDHLRSIFNVPQATLRLWDLPQTYADQWFAVPISDDIRIFSAGLSAPLCGHNNQFEAVSLLAEPETIQSVAMVPLRLETNIVGLLILGSPDPARFSEEMSTDFLDRIGTAASAALSHLLH